MKYENLKEIQSTVKEIDRLEKDLIALSEYENGQVRLIISGKESKTVMTIGCHKSFEHPLSGLAEVFITDVIQVTSDKITKLKKHPELLTDENLEEIAAGFEEDNEAKFGIYPEYVVLNGVLNDYFDVM